MKDAHAELFEHLKHAKVEGLPKIWFAQNATAVETVETEAHSPLVKSPAPAVSSVEIIAPSEMASETLLKNLPNAASEFANFSMEQLWEVASVCPRCRLCEGRNKVVFGTGNTSPQIVFVGEGPGADEDRTGEPFVGRAGALLTAAITKGMGLKREDVYICNVVKCRPPGNRAPLPDETAACTPYLYRQLELLAPKVIVTLGQPAQMALSGINTGITKLRGQWQTWRGIKLMPTFHPAYILRNPAAKRPFWEDLQEVMKEVGI